MDLKVRYPNKKNKNNKDNKGYSNRSIKRMGLPFFYLEISIFIACNHQF